MLSPVKWLETEVPVIITLVFFHGIRDPVRFLALTMETSSTAQFQKGLAWKKGRLASHPCLAVDLGCEPTSAGLSCPVGHGEALSETRGSPRLPLWLSGSGEAQFQTRGSGQRHLEAACAQILSPRNRQLNPTSLGIRSSHPALKGPQSYRENPQAEHHALP